MSRIYYEVIAHSMRFKGYAITSEARDETEALKAAVERKASKVLGRSVQLHLGVATHSERMAGMFTTPWTRGGAQVIAGNVRVYLD